MTKKLPNTLILVDIQKGFVTDCSKHLLPLVSKVQNDFKHVIFTKFYNPTPSPFREILDYQKLPPGDEETNLAIEPRPDALIVERPLYTCVTQELLDHLARLGTDEVLVCGIATEACVLKTVLDLFERNIKPWVVENLCASDQEKRYHDMAIELIAKLIGPEHVISRNDLINVPKNAA
jgi:nicotinamidase-related amidase